jgi:uncharacterized damage-inducible protein DinB
VVLNPYAKFLGAGDARVVIAMTPGLVNQAISAMTPEQIDAPISEGKWSPREIVAHLADCELVFAFRLRQTLAMPSPVIQPFDQDDWAKQYAVYDIASALAMFHAAREWNVKLIGGLSEADWQREMTHPERGTMTFQTVVETMAGHDINHLEQLHKAGNRE